MKITNLFLATLALSVAFAQEKPGPTEKALDKTGKAIDKSAAATAKGAKTAAKATEKGAVKAGHEVKKGYQEGRQSH